MYIILFALSATSLKLQAMDTHWNPWDPKCCADKVAPGQLPCATIGRVWSTIQIQREFYILESYSLIPLVRCNLLNAILVCCARGPKLHCRGVAVGMLKWHLIQWWVEHAGATVPYSTRFVCHSQGLCDTAQPTHIWSYLFKSIHYPLMSQTSKISNVSLRDQHWIEKAQFAVCSFGILNVLISSVWNVHNRHCCRHAEEIWAPPASAPISIGLACLFCPQKTCSVTRLVLLQGSQIEQQHRRVLDGK
jgi:hypothetical protein